MIGYRLCKTKTARHPFYLESISVNLYTVEELCFFLQHNPFLIDRSLVSTTLTRWIAGELGMPETALKMEQTLRKKGSLADFILPLFQSIQYLSAPELARFRKTLETLGSVSYSERLKRKGDALAENGKYAEAIRIYHQAMAGSQKDVKAEQLQSFQAVLWYNIGAVKMQLFEYEEGTEAFYESWKLKPEESSALTYLTALRLTLPEEKYIPKAETFLDEMRETLRENKKDAVKDKPDHPKEEDTGTSQNEILGRVDAYITAAREKADAKVRTEEEADPENVLEHHPERILAGIAEDYHAAAGT